MSPLETITHCRITAKLCEGRMVVSSESASVRSLVSRSNIPNTVYGGFPITPGKRRYRTLAGEVAPIEWIVGDPAPIRSGRLVTGPGERPLMIYNLPVFRHAAHVRIAFTS
jgi:hypothetical protein